MERESDWPAFRRVLPVGDLSLEAEFYLGYWLARVTNHYSHTLTRKLAQQGVSVSECIALLALYRSAPLAHVDLARAMGTTRGATSKLIDRLQRKSLVAEYVGQYDRRMLAIVPTSAGEQLVPTLAAIVGDVDRQFFAQLPERLRRDVMGAMRLLAQAHRLR